MTKIVQCAIWGDPGTLSDGTSALRLIKRGDQLTFEMDHAYAEASGLWLHTPGPVYDKCPFPDLHEQPFVLWHRSQSNARPRVRVTSLSPRLFWSRIGNNILLSWNLSHGTSWRLQANTDLAVPAGWLDVPPPYPTNATDFTATQPLPDENIFYRLYQQQK